jgi:hypothetical protein
MRGSEGVVIVERRNKGHSLCHVINPSDTSSLPLDETTIEWRVVIT